MYAEWQLSLCFAEQDFLIDKIHQKMKKMCQDYGHTQSITWNVCNPMAG